MRIKVNNLNGKRRISRVLVKKAAEAVLTGFGKKDAFIEMTFLTNRAIKRLNKKYMGRARATDVLSFLLADEAALVGDVYISSDMALANSRSFKTKYGAELILYVIHGILHLLGFGDKTNKEKKKMRKLERRFLKNIWSKENLSKA